MARIFLHDEADADLAAIEDYLTVEAGSRIAGRSLNRIVEKPQTLALFPSLGRIREDLAGSPRSFAVAPWIVFYEALPNGDGIAVWHILHGRRDLPATIRAPRR
ncbi:MAG: type II toxin-antitoxin system RelE/ParE family toxin [Alphaproteobacteria bacterium]|nr:type II toxin-antitoxin system RelE/ParE family toxin [Alphaproteobacteria bacterium]